MENSTNSSAANSSFGQENGLWLTPEPLGSHVFRLFLYAVIFLLSVFGNILVIYIVYRTRELHTVTGYLICNLSVADLGVGLFCIPFTLSYAELKFWPYGLAMCKILSSFQPMTIMASVSTLSAISFDRFRSIAYPYEPRISLSKVKYIIVAVWVLAVIIGLPFFVVTRLQEMLGIVYCGEFGWPNILYRQIYTVCSFVLTYAIPLPLMAVWYAVVVYKLEKTAKEESDKEGFRVAQAKGKVIRMLIMVVLAYFSCFLPYHVAMLWYEFGTGSKNSHYWMLLSYCQVMVYFNSCTNPILYYFFSDQFRRGFKRTVQCCRRSDKVPLRTLRSNKRLIVDRANRTFLSVNANDTEPSGF